MFVQLCTRNNCFRSYSIFPIPSSSSPFIYLSGHGDCYSSILFLSKKLSVLKMLFDFLLCAWRSTFTGLFFGCCCCCCCSCCCCCVALDMREKLFVCSLLRKSGSQAASCYVLHEDTRSNGLLQPGKRENGLSAGHVKFEHIEAKHFAAILENDLRFSVYVTIFVLYIHFFASSMWRNL